MLKIGDLTPTATADGHWTDGNVAGGVAPTRMQAGWFNAVQDELINILVSAGLVTDPKNNAQVLAAITRLTLQRANPFSDIASDGNVSIALKNLGLGTAGTRSVGTGQNQIPDMSYWQSNAGWRKTPDGVIEQWGTSAATTDTVSVTFPVQFSSAVYWIGEHDTGGGNRLTLWQLNSITGTGFQARNLGSIIKGDNAVEASISANCIWYARGK